MFNLAKKIGISEENFDRLVEIINTAGFVTKKGPKTYQVNYYYKING